MAFKKGQSGNPKGRPPVILPEVQRAVDANKNAIKVLILDQVQKNANKWIARIIEQGIGEGDIVRFKTLLEIAMGKLIDEAPEFPLSEDEKQIILEWRKKKRESKDGIDEGTDRVPEQSLEDPRSEEIQTE